MGAVEEIKQRLDIVELIGSYIPLQRAGRNYKALCPFHTEKTPSFIVFPETQRWHCFGACGTGGDIFTFVMRRENVEFSEALRMLAERAGVALEPVSPRAKEERQQQELLKEINGAAAEYYHRLLLEAKEAEPARRYLERRGVLPETISVFQLGYALQGWSAAKDALLRTYKEKDLLVAGIIARGERGNTYDRFRGRVMFPIRNAQGEVIGFGGRVLDDSQPKYLNSPDTPLFDKGSVLYGLDLMQRGIRETGTAVIVEGYMDVVIPYQCGVNNVVACLGTALSDKHVHTLQRLAKRIVLALDRDAAGMRATERGIETAQGALQRESVPVLTADGLVRFEGRSGTEMRVLLLPDERDPDELVLADRPLWDALVAEAKPVVEYLFDLVLGQVDLSTASGKRQASDRLLPVIASLGSPVERAHYLQVLAQRLRVDERTLLLELERLRKPRAGRRQAAKAKSPEAVTGLGLEEHLIARLYEQPGLLQRLREVVPLSADTFDDARHAAAFEALLPRVSLAPEEARREALASLDEGLRGYVESLVGALGEAPAVSQEVAAEEVIKSALRLRQTHLLRLISELRFVLEDAEKEGAQEGVRDTLVQIEQLTKECRDLHQRLYSVSLTGRSKMGKRLA